MIPTCNPLSGFSATDKTLGALSTCFVVQVRYIQSKVSKVQPNDDLQDGGVITLADGTALPYDWLVLALGADSNLGKMLTRYHVLADMLFDMCLGQAFLLRPSCLETLSQLFCTIKFTYMLSKDD